MGRTSKIHINSQAQPLVPVTYYSYLLVARIKHQKQLVGEKVAFGFMMAEKRWQSRGWISPLANIMHTIATGE